MISRNDVKRLVALAGEALRACRQLSGDLEAVATDPDIASPNDAVLALAQEDAQSAVYSAGRALSHIKDLEA